MCTIPNPNPIDDITVIGYKAVIKKNGKYYSPCTGLEYKVGMKIPKMKKKRVHTDGRWVDMLRRDSRYYEPLMQGRTGVFKCETQCKAVFYRVSYTILEMTLGGEIYGGITHGYHTYIGSEILNIKEL